LCDELGQYAGKLLADLGADVIKVEPPAGSSARMIGPFVGDREGPDRSLNFWYYNTNKRSVVLDYESDDEGRAKLQRLIETADILVEDHEPGQLAALGFGYSDLAALDGGLIQCAITPFGQDGPWARYRVSDMVALAAGGPMNMNGYDPEDAPGAPPIRGHGDQGYNTACHYAAIGILVALVHRDATGEGQYIDCSMHEALSSTTEVGLPYYLTKRQDVVRQTGRHASAIRTEPWVYPTGDGKDVLVFGIGRDNASWKKIKEWFQADGFGMQFDEPRFDEPANRQPARGTQEAAEIMAEVRKFFAAHTADEIYRGGQERNQAWGPVRSPEETLDDEHLHDRGFFVGVTGAGVDDPVLMPGAPYILSATPWELRYPAPKLGEHTDEVLTELNQSS
jgi:benzylsuccinate CoA-transferase BbsE subunit